MKIMIFTEGTILMHKNALGKNHKNIIKQVKEKDKSVHNYKTYIPIKNSVEKIKLWKKQGAKILYLTSRKTQKEITQIKSILNKYKFPKGKLLFRKKNEEYKDIAEKIIPDILIEDNCESIGGIKEMTITNVKPKIKKKIKSIPIKEFEGIDYLPENIPILFKY